MEPTVTWIHAYQEKEGEQKVVLLSRGPAPVSFQDKAIYAYFLYGLNNKNVVRYFKEACSISLGPLKLTTSIEMLLPI